jgi:hypothetical protein
MDAELMLNERHIVSGDAFVEMMLWRRSLAVAGSHHGFKYRHALVVKGRCVLRYDNEPGKGHRKHVGGEETPYVFTTPQALLDDFWNDVDAWRL